VKQFDWLGASPHSPMFPILEQLRLVASSNLTVLLQGETGVGKEVLVRYLHAHSLRCKAPLIPVNCGALTPSLLESTLFGSVRGAFTGAQHDSKGLVRAAHQGTLFLDEIGELPLEAQSRLLRVLQERKVTPLGCHHEIDVDFRLVCATHRDLSAAVKMGAFREDLFYRIHTFPVQIPPLRKRQGDILALANSLWQEMRQPELHFPLQESCRESLLQYAWPGNIRQLRNVLERFSVLRRQGVKLSHLLREEPATLHASEPVARYQVHVATRDWHETPEPLSIRKALEEHQFNKSRAARQLGVSRGCLHYQMQKHGIG